MLTALLLATTAITSSPFDQVVAAERAFAEASQRDGLHAAFVANFAADGVVFDPVPTNGRAAHEGKPRSKGTLSWGPAWAAVAAAGDLGFSTGPWEFRVPGEGAPPPGTGWFFTAWRKEPDGVWKVEADLGVSCALKYSPPTTVENGLAAPTTTRAPRPQDAVQARAKIEAAEQSLNTAATAGLGRAIAAVADPSIRVYRDGSAPAAGIGAAQGLLGADARTPTCVPARVTSAAAGGLGYAYGTCTPTAGARETKAFGYLRVWRRQPDGTWRVFVDVTP
jgi:ketosteroid isomerase-like protein